MEETPWELDGDRLLGGSDNISLSDIKQFAGDMPSAFCGGNGFSFDEFQVSITGQENIAKMVRQGVRFEGYERYINGGKEASGDKPNLR